MYYSHLIDFTDDSLKAGRAHFHLALIEEERLVEDSDPHLGLLHLMAASSLLYPPANMALGYKYTHGIGVLFNRNLAINMYLLACNMSIILPFKL